MGRSKFWNSTKRWRLGQISKSIAYYEMKEGLTLFELALWKAKIDDFKVEGDKDSVAEDTAKKAKIDVEGARKEARVSFNADTHSQISRKQV